MGRTRRDYLGILFILPSLLGFIVFFAAPFFMSIVYSFTNGVGNLRFVGFKNYAGLIKSASFRLAFLNTFKFIAAGVPLLIIISLFMASVFLYLLKKNIRGIPFLLTANITSIVIPSAAIILFVQILFERFGVLNGLRYGQTVDWLRTGYSFYIILALYLWKNCGYIMIIFITIIGGIDKAVYEAAALDGAGAFTTFFKITLPLIKNAVVFAVVTGIMGVFKMFRESYLLTGDYPHESIYSLQNFMNNNFYNLNYQRLSASSVLFFIIMSLVIIGMLVISARDNTYQ